MHHTFNLNADFYLLHDLQHNVVKT